MNCFLFKKWLQQTICLQIIYNIPIFMYIQDFALNKPQVLICHKIQPKTNKKIKNLWVSRMFLFTEESRKYIGEAFYVRSHEKLHNLIYFMGII